MKCPYCNHPDSKVTDSRAMEDGIRRRRECLKCGVRFTTYERTQTMALVISKRDGRREEFRRDKLMAGIVKACTKRPIPMKDIERLVEEIEADLQSLGRSEIPSSLLGQLVMERLKRLDRVAYIRFASVYQDFKDISSFEQAVRELRAEAISVNEPATPFAIVQPAEPAKEASGQLSFLSAVGESQPRAKGRRPHAHT